MSDRINEHDPRPIGHDHQPIEERSSEAGDVSRRDFLRNAGVGAVGLAALPWFSVRAAGSDDRVRLLERSMFRPLSGASTQLVRFGLIGAGGMGQGDLQTALNLPGTAVTAACDLYDSRLGRCRERWGANLFITRDHRELLSRKDVDAVIVATSDHWHERITADALRAGKPVYLEKPMIQNVEEGHRLIDVQRQTGVPLMVGSQRTSSILYEKARDLLAAGEIGDLNFVEGYWDRYSAIGAWQYSIPPSADARQIDWTRYRQGLPDKPFSAMEFFRWRNYDDYGTGVAGDLFVHLFSGLHLITGSTGPTTIMGTGGLRFWRDQRTAEDVVLGLYHYPAGPSHSEFSLSLRVNFADGSGGGSRIRLVGTEGEITIGWDRITLKKAVLAERPGKSTGDLSEDMRKEYDEWYAAAYPDSRAKVIEPSELVYRAPEGYDDRRDHFANFLATVRDGQPVVQDALFGLRAAGPAVLTTTALRERRLITWDPVSMKVV
jgi:predicted dehydrogenase